MTIERLRELLALGHRRSTEEEQEFEDLLRNRRQEQRDAIPRPTCCAEILKYPVITFSIKNSYGCRDTNKAEGHWHFRVGESFWYDFGVGDLSEYITGVPDPKYCPFCGTPVPKMVRKNPPPPNICRVTDGGYHCDICHERLDACICDPPSAAFEPCSEDPLRGIPDEQASIRG